MCLHFYFSDCGAATVVKVTFSPRLRVETDLAVNNSDKLAL